MFINAHDLITLPLQCLLFPSPPCPSSFVCLPRAANVGGCLVGDRSRTSPRWSDPRTQLLPSASLSGQGVSKSTAWRTFWNRDMKMPKDLYGDVEGNVEEENFVGQRSKEDRSRMWGTGIISFSSGDHSLTRRDVGRRGLGAWNWKCVDSDSSVEMAPLPQPTPCHPQNGNQCHLAILKINAGGTSKVQPSSQILWPAVLLALSQRPASVGEGVRPAARSQVILFAVIERIQNVTLLLTTPNSSAGPLCYSLRGLGNTSLAQTPKGC